MTIAMSLLSSSEPFHPGQPLPEMPTLPRNSTTAPLGTEAWPAPGPAVVLYIDRQQLSRDCVGEQLAGHLADWTVRSVMSIREVTSLADLSEVSIIVFNSHSGSFGSDEVKDEVMAIREAASGTPLIVMSDLEDTAEVRRSMEHGARGYLPAHLPLSHAMAAIRFVKDGGTYIPQCVLTSIVQEPSTACLVDGDGDSISFSPRQLQVLELLKEGKQNKIIAYELGMCESTVKVHIRLIMRKLKAGNRTQVVLLTQGLQTSRSQVRAA
jgi:DNA-binding NarL/FixJ family response regulator